MATRRYRSPARERAAASTRSLILDAAAENFSLNGYPSATIAGIARTADVGVNTVYTAFGSKARLLATLITTAADNEITWHFDEVVGEASTGAAVIGQLAESVRQNTGAGTAWSPLPWRTVAPTRSSPKPGTQRCTATASASGRPDGLPVP